MWWMVGLWLSPAGIPEDVPSMWTDDTLLARYAPEVHLTTYCTDGSGTGCDWTRPSSIDWYLRPGVPDVGAAMRYNKFGSDKSVASPGTLTAATLTTQSYDGKSPSAKGSTDETDEPFFLQPRRGTGSGSDFNAMHHGVYGGAQGWNPTLFPTDGAGASTSALAALSISPDAEPGAGAWVMYATVRPTSRFGAHGAVRDLQYWTFYPYDDADAGFNHESDWEHVTIGVDEGNNPKVLFMSEHNGGTLFLPDHSAGCASGWVSQYTMRVNKQSKRVCLRRSPDDSAPGAWHMMAWSADGTHALFPDDCGGTCTWSSPNGAQDDTTTLVGPVWRPWRTSPQGGNLAVVTDDTDWVTYAGLWGEVGISDLTSGKWGPRWQDWGAGPDSNPNGPM